MRPTLVETTLPGVGAIAVPSYTVALALGIVVALGLFRRWGERAGLPGRRLVDVGAAMILAGLVGARLVAVVSTGQLFDFIHLCTDPGQVAALDAPVSHCTTDAQCGPDYLCDGDRNRCHPPRDCLAALKFWRPGLVFYGGLLAAIPVGAYLARRQGLPLLRAADIAAPALLIGLLIGRLGCFMEGCCYGAETNSQLGVNFPGHAHGRHPTQLYGAGIALALFALLRYGIAPRARRPGQVLGWLLVLYAGSRIGLEVLRADPRGGLGPLSTSQIISIPALAAGAYLIWGRRRIRNRPRGGSA